MSEGNGVFDAFICHKYFIFCRSYLDEALTESFPGEMASEFSNNVVKHGAKFEKRGFCAIRERIFRFGFAGRYQSTKWSRGIFQGGEG